MGAVIDPRSDRRYLGLAQSVATHRHRRIGQTGQHLIQTALLGPTGHQCPPARATRDGVVTRAQIEIRQLRSLSVTIPTTPLKNRPDVVSKRDRFGLGLHHTRAQDHEDRANHSDGPERGCERRLTPGEDLPHGLLQRDRNLLNIPHSIASTTLCWCYE